MGILFCKAERSGPLSVTTGLVARVWWCCGCDPASISGWVETTPDQSCQQENWHDLLKWLLGSTHAGINLTSANKFKMFKGHLHWQCQSQSERTMLPRSEQDWPKPSSPPRPLTRPPRTPHLFLCVLGPSGHTALTLPLQSLPQWLFSAPIHLLSC